MHPWFLWSEFVADMKVQTNSRPASRAMNEDHCRGRSSLNWGGESTVVLVPQCIVYCVF